MTLKKIPKKVLFVLLKYKKKFQKRFHNVQYLNWWNAIQVLSNWYKAFWFPLVTIQVAHSRTLMSIRMKVYWNILGEKKVRTRLVEPSIRFGTLKKRNVLSVPIWWRQIQNKSQKTKKGTDKSLKEKAL